jgi:pimeloyl-ACP methyl ester carboxylesterase
MLAVPTATTQMPDVDGVEHRFADVRGVRMHYAEAGEGKPIVLVHGWPQHWWSWRHVIGPLAERNRVICPDIRGMGWSEGSRGGYALDDLAADVLGLADALGLERFALVGHDWGAALGYRAALYWPRRVERFVPLGGVTPWSSDGARPALWTRPWHLFAYAFLGSRVHSRLPRRVLRTWRYRGDFTPEEARAYLDPIRRPSATNATVRFDRNIVFNEVPRAVRRHRLWRLRVPTLHLNGEHDPLTQSVPRSYRLYADEMTLEEIPGCGHFIPEEAPDDFLERLIEFLKGRA